MRGTNPAKTLLTASRGDTIMENDTKVKLSIGDPQNPNTT